MKEKQTTGLPAPRSWLAAKAAHEFWRETSFGRADDLCSSDFRYARKYLAERLARYTLALRKLNRGRDIPPLNFPPTEIDGHIVSTIRIDELAAHYPQQTCIQINSDYCEIAGFVPHERMAQ